VSIEDETPTARNTVPELGYGKQQSTEQNDGASIPTETEKLGFMHRSMLSKHLSNDTQTSQIVSSRSLHKGSMPVCPATQISRAHASKSFEIQDHEVERYLHKYQSLLHYFPFLPLPPNWTAYDMRMNHPFFLLGIISAMTIHDLRTNPRVHSHFLRVLAERVVVQGEKSLDIVRGILVQLAWYIGSYRYILLLI
jgi:hypothetical protein